MNDPQAPWLHWRPYSTVPIGRPIMLARFPAPVGEKPWFGVVFYPDLLSPKPTHWSEVYAPAAPKPETEISGAP